MSASLALRGRRFHQKSRKGCQQCKRRKVKCDEKKPVCDKCRRYGVDCSFAPPNRIGIEEALASSRRSISSDRNTTSCSSSRTSRQRSPRWIPVEAPHAPPSAGFELAIADLELLHHYTTSTAYTFSLHPALQTLWRVEVPRIGFTASYTLRAIPAISALHLAVPRSRGESCTSHRQASTTVQHSGLPRLLYRISTMKMRRRYSSFQHYLPSYAVLSH